MSSGSLTPKAKGIKTELLGTPTNKTIQDLIDDTQASGKTSGGGFTDNGTGTVKVAAGTGYIRATDSATAEILSFDWAENAALTLSDGEVNYILVEYGSPATVTATTTKADGNNRNKILLGKIYREGSTLHMVEAGMLLNELSKNVLSYLTKLHGDVVRVSGLVLAEKATQNLTITGGVVFAGLTSNSVSAFDSSATDFTYWYNNGSWQSSSTGTINNTQYNNYGTGLANLTAGKYGAHWVYMHDDGDVHVVYGTTNKNLRNTLKQDAPSNLPPMLTDFGFLIGRIVILKNATTYEDVGSAFEESFVSGTPTNHDELGTLAWADAGHTGTADNLAGFDGSGNATDITDIPDGITATTQSSSDNSTKLATTEYVESAVSAAGGGDVTKVGTPVDNQVGVWTGDGTIEGTSGLTYDGSNLQLTGDIGSTGTRITKAWLADLTVTNDIAGDITGNAGTVTVADESVDTTCYPLFATGTAGSFEPKTGTNLTFNSATGMVTATGFTGALTGNADTVTNGVYTTNKLSALSATTSAELAGVISDETGTGALVFGTAPQISTVELGHASDTTLSRNAAGVLAVEGVVIPSISSTNTLTNKRVNPRVGSVASSATPTINTDNYDAYKITALAANITSFTTNLSGTPVDFQKLTIRILDNGTGRTISWGASFQAMGADLPTSTTAGKVTTVGLVYDSVDSKWGCVANVEEA